MIFSSKNEEGIIKADWMSSLPIGATAITRRSIKPNDKCSNCDFEFWKHSPDVRGKLKYSFSKATKEEIEKQGWKVNGETVQRSCHSFFPAKFKIGKQIKIQKKRCGSALCDCSYEKNEHEPVTDEDMIDKWLQCPEVEDNLAEFKPILYEIVAGCWHKSWMKKNKIKVLPSGDILAPSNDVFLNEVKSEGFISPNNWLDYYPAHKIDINSTWRIQLQRIQ